MFMINVFFFFCKFIQRLINHKVSIHTDTYTNTRTHIWILYIFEREEKKEQINCSNKKKDAETIMNRRRICIEIDTKVHGR
jgi:hypothetical protein